MNTRTGRLLGIVAAAIAVAIGTFGSDATRAAPAEADDLRGTVSDGTTGKPVAGATVTVWRRDAPLPREPPIPAILVDLDWPARSSRSAKTDAAGRYEFPREPRAGLRWLTFSAPGYAMHVVDATQAGPAFDVPLVPAPPQNLRILRKGRDGDVPAAGVQLLLFPDADVALLGALFTVAADGSVSLPLGPNPDVVARGAGVATTRLRPHPDGTTLRPLEPGGPIAGIVVTPKGTPVAGATATLLNDIVSLRTKTDGAGAFRFEGTVCDRSGASLWIDATGCARTTMQVWGGDTGLTVVAAPSVRVRGRVVGPDGKPMGRAWVRSDTEAKRLSAPDGSFEFDSVPYGIQTFIASKGSREEVLEGQATLDLRPDVDLQDLTLRLVPQQRRVSLRVIDERGAPLAGVTVSHSVSHPRFHSEAVTGADGRAALDVPAESRGELEIELRGGAFGAVEQVAQIPRESALRGPVDIVRSTPVKLALRVLDGSGAVQPAGEIVAMILPPDSGPVPTFEMTSTVPIIGKSEVTVPSRTPFRLRIASRAGARWSSVIRASDAKDGVLEIRLPRVSTMRGRVGLPDGASSFDVLAMPEGGAALDAGPRQVTESFRDGEFRLEGLAPGRWRLLIATQPDGEMLADRRFDVPGTGEVDLGDVTTRRVTVRGTVRAGGRPVPGASVTIDCPDGPLTAGVVAAPDGTYVLRLPVGLDGTLAVRRAGHGAVGRPFRAAADETVDLEMAPEARLLVRNARDALLEPLRLVVRAGGTEHVRFAGAQHGGDAVVLGVAAGPVEIVVGEGAGARTVRADAKPGVLTEIDLGAK